MYIRSPGTDWNDCCYYVKSFGILFPRYGNSVEDDPDNSYGSPYTRYDVGVYCVYPDGVVFSDDYVIINSYGK